LDIGPRNVRALIEQWDYLPDDNAAFFSEISPGFKSGLRKASRRNGELNRQHLNVACAA